ncbi:MAG: 3-deoxy-D-manno-octulosonic acid kinase [Arenimonas sp.]|nr:3-deoxy-D-manno-octulosonic acid kinase [Arenimonas sp.]
MEDNATAAARRECFRDARGPGAIVFDPARLPQARVALLDPALADAGAQPVQGSGRGAAWFVQGAWGRGVLRHYRRGGLAARVSADAYLWLGESRVRSIEEFRLLQALHRDGLPVPAPLLAGYWRSGLGYRAALLVERIEGATSLAGRLGPMAGAVPWEAVGRMLARFHAAGVDHADLNASNILFGADDRPWLIDFDRGKRRATGGRWARGNLDRLARSLAKLAGDTGGWRAGYERLLSAYRGAGT